MKQILNPAVKRHLACAIVVLATGILYADDKDKDQSTSSTSETGGDKSTMFVKETLQGNAIEIALSEVATRQSQNAEVKQLAERLRKDHTEANQKLQPIAQKLGVQASPTLDAKHQKKVEKMQQLSGDQFDKEYVKALIQHHNKCISKFEKVSSQAQDPALQQFARQNLPALREHLTESERVAKAIGIDQETISSLKRETPEGVGGTSDPDDSSSATGKQESQKEGADKNNPNRPQ
jgi:putative membrane protein